MHGRAGHPRCAGRDATRGRAPSGLCTSYTPYTPCVRDRRECSAPDGLSSLRDGCAREGVQGVQGVQVVTTFAYNCHRDV
jgi:hypothetical protein